jgi:hypothetical protein
MYLQLCFFTLRGRTKVLQIPDSECCQGSGNERDLIYTNATVIHFSIFATTIRASRTESEMPFEFLGAVSRWRIELPPENNYFDFDSLSDCIVRLNYTACEGGELRRANEAAQRHLPGDGWCFFVRSRLAPPFFSVSYGSTLKTLRLHNILQTAKV